jgi:hypothetical protein
MSWHICNNQSGGKPNNIRVVILDADNSNSRECVLPYRVMLAIIMFMTHYSKSIVVSRPLRCNLDYVGENTDHSHFLPLCTLNSWSGCGYKASLCGMHSAPNASLQAADSLVSNKWHRYNGRAPWSTVEKKVNLREPIHVRLDSLCTFCKRVGWSTGYPNPECLEYSWSMQCLVLIHPHNYSWRSPTHKIPNGNRVRVCALGSCEWLDCVIIAHLSAQWR